MAQLIPYAGREDAEPRLTRAETALRMFRSGSDTYDIAKHFQIHESIALRWVTQEREREMRVKE